MAGTSPAMTVLPNVMRVPVLDPGINPRICTLPRTIIVIPPKAGIQLLQQSVITGLDPVIFSRVAGYGRIKSGHDVL
jgi:hypothetical protein